MSEDSMNGVALLLEDIESEFRKKRMSAKDKIILRSLEYILKSIPPIREDVKNLKSVSVGYRMWQNPKASFIFIFVLYSFAISGLPVLFFQWFFSMAGTIMKGF
jgi:hypothetical protein